MIIQNYEEELQALEKKFDKQIINSIENRNKIIKESKREVYSDFWLRVLTNHKFIKEFITENDRDSLKFIQDITYNKLDDGNVINWI